MSDGVNVFTSDEFQLTIPPGWRRAPEAQRLTFVDERGAVLIVSSVRVAPRGASGILDQVIANAFASVKHAASDPDLIELSVLRETPHRSLRCWTTHARTHDQSLYFSQAVLASSGGVVLATLETLPPEEAHREAFRAFVDTVELVGGT